MFCHAGTPRNTIYALDKPANSMMTAVSRIQTPIWPLEIGNDDPESEESSPPRPPGGGGGGRIIPDRRSSVITGITTHFPTVFPQNQCFAVIVAGTVCGTKSSLSPGMLKSNGQRCTVGS